LTDEQQKVLKNWAITDLVVMTLGFSDLDFFVESPTSAREQRRGPGYPRLSVLLRQAADRAQPLAGRSYPFPGQRAGPSTAWWN